MGEKLNTIDDLCYNIGISPKFLKYVLYVKKDKYYDFKIPKKNGDFRSISSPCRELKYIQRQLLKFFEKEYSFLDCQHGFIKGRSCVTNAKLHVGKRFVLNGDIEHFFDTIHFGRVRGIFLNKPFYYSKEVATIIAKITCYNKKLPQGAPTSPFVSNIICYTMDKKLDYIAKKYNCRYSRYADDITFSTDSELFPTEIANIKNESISFSKKIIRIINGGYENGFVFNDKKTRFYKRYNRQEVTGVVVNKKTNVNKYYLKNIRAIIHCINYNGFVESYFKTFKSIPSSENYAKNILFNYLCGKISYLKMVRGDSDGLFLKYANDFNNCFKTEVFDISDEMRVRKYIGNKCYVIECGANYGTGFTTTSYDNIIYTSTHVIVDKNNCPSFVYDSSSSNYSKQFPIYGKSINLLYILNKNLKNKRTVVDYYIDQESYEKDILLMPVKTNKKNNLKISNRKAKLGDIVFLVGYPCFNGFDNTSIHVIKTKVIGENILFGRKLINTLDSPKHGMSGGPVLNSNNEVVGIVYAGNDDNSENVGFISLV